MKESQDIPLEKIDIPKKYKRENSAQFANEQRLLAQSIKSVGMRFPITVKRAGKRFQLIDGGRRMAVLRMQLRADTVMAYVIPENDSRDPDALRFHLNYHRENLKPMDEARLIRELIAVEGMLKTDVAKALGKKVNTLNRILDCLRLDDRWQKLINSGQLNIHAGQSIAALSRKGQRELYQVIKSKALPFTDQTIREVVRTFDPIKNPQLFHNPKQTAGMRINETHGHPVAFKKVEGVAKQRLMIKHRQRLLKQYEDEINIAIPIIGSILSNMKLCEELSTRSLNAFTEFAEEYI